MLKLEFAGVAADERGRMNLDALEDELRKGDVGTVVATLGTTAMGAVDPLDEILALKERYGFRVHVDAAYGGYFGLIAEALDEPARRAYAAIGQADSIVIDPHKHGLQPYGCGCVLFRDPAVGRFYKHDSPYTYFTSKELHLGEISLECSRAGAAAVALWATQRLLPLVAGRRVCAGVGEGAASSGGTGPESCGQTRGSLLWEDRFPGPQMRGTRGTRQVCRSWTLWCGHWRCMRQTLGLVPSKREQCSMHARRGDCIWRLCNCQDRGLGWTIARRMRRAW